MEKVRSALSFIPSDDREIWVKVGLAIKSEYGEGGFDLWDSWSQTSESYKSSSAKAVWKSLRSTKVSIKTMFYIAVQNGWEDDGTVQEISPEEKQRRELEADKRRKAEEAKVRRNNKRAAFKALQLWRSAKVASPDHPYLVRKQTPAVDTLREIHVDAASKILGYHPKTDEQRLTGRLLVVPIKIAGKLSSCEMIDEHGRKSAIYGGARIGGYWAAQPLPEDTPGAVVAIGEGVATMLSTKLATGFNVVGALTHHNIAEVVKYLKPRYTKARLLIIGDLQKSGAPDPCAIKAADATQVPAVFPEFETQGGGTDFNDMHVAYGLDRVNRVLHKHS